VEYVFSIRKTLKIAINICNRKLTYSFSKIPFDFIKEDINSASPGDSK